MIVSYQKEMVSAKLKKAYSTISQTIPKAIIDYGQVNSWDIPDDSSPTATKTFLDKYIVRYLNVKNKSEIYSNGNWDNTKICLNGDKAYFYTNKTIRFYLNDGISVTVSRTSTKNYNFYIDINGDRKPNTVGKDIFYFTYYLYDTHALVHQVANTKDFKLQGKFLPWYYGKSRSELLACSAQMCNKQNGGEACAALIMKDGWKIADDYPW